MSCWHLYLIRTAKGHLYTGITTDVARRLAQHQQGRGAKALRGRGPLQLVFSVEVGDRRSALKAEYAVKQLPKIHKEQLVRGEFSPAWLLSRDVP